MRYAFLVAWREYSESAKTRGFWIGLFMVPAMILISIQVQLWLAKSGTPTRHFFLVDQSQRLEPAIDSALDKNRQRQLLAALVDYTRKNLLHQDALSTLVSSAPLAQLDPGSVELLETFIGKGGRDFFLKQVKPYLRPDAPPFVEPRPAFERVKLPPEIKTDKSIGELAADLKPYLRGDRRLEAGNNLVEIDAAILIPKDVENLIVRPGGGGPVFGTNGIQYWSANLTDAGTGLRDEVEKAVSGEIRQREFLRRGLDSAAVRDVERSFVPILSLNPKKEAGQEAVNTTDIVKQYAPIGFVYLLWISIFSIMQMLLNNIIEEKSSRIIEVLLSSVTPGELMIGKLCGIAAIGLTMVGAWIVTTFVILGWQSGNSSELAGQVLAILKTTRLVPVFSVYFILGYLLYAGLILSLGSVCNTLKEAQSYMAVLNMVMMVPLLTMMFIPRHPNGPLARVLSWIPIYTPFTMMNRANADPPMVDVVGTMILLVICTAGTLWMAGKIFRIGILRSGQPPKIVEMLRWLKG